MASDCLRLQRVDAPVATQRTHVNARGVEGALVGDAGVADGVWEAAVGQEAPPTVDDGSDDRRGEPDGRGGAHGRGGHAHGEERPRLREGGGKQSGWRFL